MVHVPYRNTTWASAVRYYLVLQWITNDDGIHNLIFSICYIDSISINIDNIYFFRFMCCIRKHFGITKISRSAEYLKRVYFASETLFLQLACVNTFSKAKVSLLHIFTA